MPTVDEAISYLNTIFINAGFDSQDQWQISSKTISMVECSVSYFAQGNEGSIYQISQTQLCPLFNIF